MASPAIVIDNGSFECRAGFSTETMPKLQFRNIVMKPRSRIKETFVGSVNEELDPNLINSKSAFELNVVTQLEVQETVFDHIFSNLGIKSCGIEFPIILSEPLCCPQQSRSQITEVLFETYSANKLTYFVDGLASYYTNFGTSSSVFNLDTILVSFGYHTTHIIPYSGGSHIPSACRRLSVGGAHVSWYLQRLLSLKYPCHSDKFTIPVAEELIQTFGKVCENYREEMQLWKDETYKEENTQTWCLPYSDETQRKAQELVERRQFQADRLREMHRKRALDRLREDRTDSDESGPQVRRIDDLTESETGRSPTSIYDGDTGEEAVLKKLVNLRERKATELLSSFQCPAAVQAQMTTQPSNTQSFNEQKLRRRVLAANYLESRRERDFCFWLSKINHKRQRIAKQRALRQSKVDLATELGLHNQDNLDDGKVAMTIQNSLTERKQRKIDKIRAMTSELRPERGSGGKRGGGRGSARKTVPRKESGRNVVEVASNGDEESWMEEEVTLESFDAFSEEVGSDLIEVGDGVSQQGTCPVVPPSPPLLPTSATSDVSNSKSRSRDAFGKLEDEAADLSECERDQLAVLDSVRAFYDPEFLKETGTVGLKIDVSEYYKVHLSTEPIRATEILFERSLMGNSQAGVGECLSWVLRSSSKYLYEYADKTWVPRRLFLTGGLAKLRGIKDRLGLELQQLLPWRADGDPLEVVAAVDPSLDAWRGAQVWSKHASENGFKQFTTRRKYEECGYDYLAENVIGNRFYASFKDLEINPKFNPGRGRQPTATVKPQPQEL